MSKNKLSIPEQEESVGSIEAITNRMCDLALKNFDGSKEHNILLNEISNLEIANALRRYNEKRN